MERAIRPAPRSEEVRLLASRRRQQPTGGTHSRSDAANFKLTKNDGTRIEGAYATRNASAKRSPDTEGFDLTFALDAVPSK